jgi:putative restriction endonuclease
MKYWVGVTDNDWFAFLAGRGLDEVNFWRPSPGPYFTNLPAGTLFLFKLKSPFNHIAGGGFFAQYSTLPIEMVWDALGEKNGAASFREFDYRIRSYRNMPKGPLEMGSNVLVEPFFFPKEQWIPLTDWPRSIVQGKTYDNETPEGAWLWNEVQLRLQDRAILGLVAEPAAEYGGSRYGELFLTRSRLGQGAFRVLVSEAYGKRCAITGESTLPVLEAAHIRPYEMEGPHKISNGLLLRSDFHKLFDAGLVAVTPELRVQVSPRIHEQWYNGKAYYRLQDQPLAVVPKLASQQPDPEFLRWHLSERFVA